jgi:hypothetical protein
MRWPLVPTVVQFAAQDNNLDVKKPGFIYNADAVVAEIRAAGGIAVPDYHNIVTEADAIVKNALKVGICLKA